MDEDPSADDHGAMMREVIVSSQLDASEQNTNISA
jgi:hypothetical protein